MLLQLFRSLGARLRNSFFEDYGRDVHHGNGVQDIFYDDPTVLYISIHRGGFEQVTMDARQTATVWMDYDLVIHPDCSPLALPRCLRCLHLARAVLLLPWDWHSGQGRIRPRPRCVSTYFRGFKVFL
jgi:hypothetical protein